MRTNLESDLEPEGPWRIATTLCAILGLLATLAIAPSPAQAQDYDPQQCTIGGVAVESVLVASECSVLDGWVNAGQGDEAPADPCEWERVYCDESGLALIDMGRQEVPIPQDIGELWSLRGLSLSEAKHSAFPDSMFGLPNLQWLDLNENDLSEFPTELGRLDSLRVLNLNFNHDLAVGPPRTVPASFGELTSLEVLKIGHMSIRTLPPEIANLSHLKWLDVQGPLTLVPDEMTSLTELCHIGIIDNSLAALPQELQPLANAGFDNGCDGNDPQFSELVDWFHAPSSEPDPVPFVLGDVDCSGQLSVLDALGIVLYAAELREDGGPCPLSQPLATHIAADRGDYNRDGRVNVIDALGVLRCTLGHEGFCV